jgi:hypothetical protein
VKEEDVRFQMQGTIIVCFVVELVGRGEKPPFRDDWEKKSVLHSALEKEWKRLFFLLFACDKMAAMETGSSSKWWQWNFLDA